VTGPGEHPQRGDNRSAYMAMGNSRPDNRAADLRWRLDGRVALVTGASSGLGARFARVLHQAGANVLVTARRGDRLDELASECGERIDTMTGDITARHLPNAFNLTAVSMCWSTTPASPTRVLLKSSRSTKFDRSSR
jgi:hypothetical protein